MSRQFRKPIEPIDPRSVTQEAIDLFDKAGWGDDSKWLGPLSLGFFEEELSPDSPELLSDIGRHNIAVIARSRTDAGGDRDRALLVAFTRLCGCGDRSSNLFHRPADPDKQPSEPARMSRFRDTAAVFRAHNADFEGALVIGGWPGQYDGNLGHFARQSIDDNGVFCLDEMPPIARLMHVLIDAAGLDLCRVVDRDKLATVGARRWGSNPEDYTQRQLPVSVAPKPDPISDARSLSNWLMALGTRALRLYFPALQAARNDSEAGGIALGVRDAIETWLFQAVHHWTSFSEAQSALREFGPAMRLYFDLLHARHCASTQPPSSALRKAWLWFGWAAFEADPVAWEDLPDEVRKSVFRAATEELAQLRKLLARATPMRMRAVPGMPYLLAPEVYERLDEKQPPPWLEFEWERENLETCLILLFSLGGIWRGLKPMLLAWRALQAPAVANDLRYWNEPGFEAAPIPWHLLVEWPINLFHHFAAREESRDPHLVKLRGELASFCLERLADRLSKAQREAADRENRPRTDEDMVEPSPEWRYCLIRAASALGINPEGKGHRILLVASERDPEPEVRDAANQCYQQMRRGVGLPDGVSPRRAIMSALWWIRQAHLLGLGIEPDPDGAQRTRVKELARTKESKRVDKPAAQDSK